MQDRDVQREMQIADEQKQDWGAWTERALAELWTEFGDQLPYRDAVPQGTEASSEEEAWQ
jgi:hypothetical protein